MPSRTTLSHRVSPEPILGAIMAGGRNTRYGGLKALDTVGGTRIVDRVTAAVRAVTSAVGLIANDAAAYASVALPMRPDAQPGLGALGGLLTALQWAGSEGRSGILAVACDMPFVSSELLRSIAHTAEERSEVDVIAPESSSRRGLEPLCAYYSVRCLPALEQAVARGDLRMIGFHDQVHVHRIPLAEVQRFGDPDILFMNVNTPAERDRAEQIARASST